MSLELMLGRAQRGPSGACTHRRRFHSWHAASAVLALLALTATASLAATVDVRPLVSADDAEEATSGGMYLNSGDLEFFVDGATQQMVGIRWPAVAIPQGATITSAWVQFYTDEAQSEPTTLTIRAQAVDNAAAFAATTGNISTRSLGSASATWSPAAWTTVGEAGPNQRTPELKTLIQAVVNRAGWLSGNALVLVFTGSGHRTAFAVDASLTKSPVLHVEYSGGGPPPPNVAPVASLNVTVAASPPLTVNASGAGSTDTDANPIASYRFDWGDGTAATTVTAPTSSATHTYASAGTYTVTLTVTDTGALTSLPASANVTVSGGGGGTGTPVTVEQRTLATSDDAEETVSSGAVNLSSGDLELVQDSNVQAVGMRWSGLAIPRGAVITTAWVQFTARDAQSMATQLKIQALAADAAATFTTTARDVTSRPRTGAEANWTPVAWAAGGAGAEQRTPELRTLVQEVVSRTGWQSGNALAMIVTGTGRRNAWSRDGNRLASPLLHVEYTTDGSPPPPPQNTAPVARLTVTPAASPPLTVTASGATSTDTDANPIASYRFTFGDNTPAVVTNTPTAVTTHTYANPGTYTVTLTVTDTGGLTSTPVSVPVTVSTQPAGTLAVYVGYYSTHHPDEPKPKPSPWMGSPGVVFVGTPDSPSGGWDTCGLRIDNNSGSSVTVTATVDIGSYHFALWGSRSIPAGQKLILAQTGFENFDGSDTSPAGCYGCDPKWCLTKVVSTVPVVNLTVGGVTTRYYDSGQVMNTKGADGAGCPPINGRRDESQNWVQIFTTGSVALTTEEASTIPGTTSAGALWMAPPYPNPVRDALTLRFHTARRGIVTLEVYDVAGRLVTTALDTDLEPGEYLKVLPVRGIMAGRYFARLRTSEGELRQSFVIAR